jgi:hypothetical protein
MRCGESRGQRIEELERRLATLTRAAESARDEILAVRRELIELREQERRLARRSRREGRH